MILSALKTASRRLSRERAFTLTSVLTLGVAIGGAVAVFALVEAVLLRPLPYPGADDVVQLMHRDTRTGVTKEFIAMGDYVDLTARQRSFETLTSFGGGQTTLRVGEEAFRVGALGAGPGLLEMLGVRPAVGRTFQPEDHREDAPLVVMLAWDTWQERFAGDPDVVGTAIGVATVEGVIVGVAPRGFAFPPTDEYGVIYPMQPPTAAPTPRTAGWMFAVGRLAPGVSAGAAGAEMAELSRALAQEYPGENEGSQYYLVPLREALVGDTRPALLLLMAAVGLVLVMACANVANLHMARALDRRTEFATRVAIGASRRGLAGMLVAESFVVAGLACVAGTLLASWIVQGLVALTPADLEIAGLRDVGIGGTPLLLALLIAGGTTVLFGLVAAATTPLRDGALTASRGSTTDRVARRATSGLVVGQIGLATVLLLGAGLMLRSFVSLIGVDPGFEPRGVLTMVVQQPGGGVVPPEEAAAFWPVALDALKALPEVDEAGTAAVMPLTGNNWTSPFERADRRVPEGQRSPDVGWQSARGGFFTAMGIPLIEGRLFDDRDREGPPVRIISESLARLHFPEGAAVGKHVMTGDGQTAEIVGVVGDIRRAGLTDEPRADMYFPGEPGGGLQATVFLKVRGDDPARIVPAVRTALQRLRSGIELTSIRTMEEVSAESIRTTTLLLWLLGVFAAGALGLAGVGVYSVVSYAVRQRTREIGTRMAIGATARDIRRIVLGSGAAMAGLGLAIGGVAGLLATRSLEGILFGVRATDPQTIAATLIVLIAATLLGAWIPARRAARVDPARVLMR